MNYNISTSWAVAIALLAVWELAWKGVALWKASRNNRLDWYLVILIINSVGILPITYLLLSRKSTAKSQKAAK